MYSQLYTQLLNKLQKEPTNLLKLINSVALSRRLHFSYFKKITFDNQIGPFLLDFCNV